MPLAPQPPGVDLTSRAPSALPAHRVVREARRGQPAPVDPPTHGSRKHCPWPGAAALRSSVLDNPALMAPGISTSARQRPPLPRVLFLGQISVRGWSPPVRSRAPAVGNAGALPPRRRSLWSAGRLVRDRACGRRMHGRLTGRRRRDRRVRVGGAWRPSEGCGGVSRSRPFSAQVRYRERHGNRLGQLVRQILDDKEPEPDDALSTGDRRRPAALRTRDKVRRRDRGEAQAAARTANVGHHRPLSIEAVSKPRVTSPFLTGGVHGDAERWCWWASTLITAGSCHAGHARTPGKRGSSPDRQIVRCQARSTPGGARRRTPARRARTRTGTPNDRCDLCVRGLSTARALSQPLRALSQPPATLAQRRHVVRPSELEPSVLR